MHLSQRQDGVWIEVPVQQWVANESEIPSTFLDQIQFISQSELVTLSSKQKDALSELELGHLSPIGIAQSGDIHYIIVIWNAGYLFRKKAKLTPTPLFYVSSTPFSPNLTPRIDQLLHPFDAQRYDAQILDHLAFALLHSGDLTFALQAAIALCEKSPESEKGWLRLGDISFKMEHYKLAMLSYGRILHLVTASHQMVTHAVQRIYTCSTHTEWGPVFLEEETHQIPESLRALLLLRWTDGLELLKESTHDVVPTLQIGQWRDLLVPVDSGNYAPLPSFFRWVVPFQVALSSAPASEKEIERLASVGIRHIISLDAQRSPEKIWLHHNSIKHTLVPVEDFHPPTIEQVDCIMDLLGEPSNLPALIHCAAGLGRTGTIAACYIAAFGFQLPKSSDQMPCMQASQAIDALRAIRPGSVETRDQEGLVARWVNEVWRRKSILRPPVDEPAPCSLEVIGNVPRDADLLVLVGLQGSGKSWFARALRAREPTKWKRVSQDESGSRSTCESELGRDPYGKRVILDRCNPDGKDRTYWVKLAHWAKQPVLVWFDYPKDLCIERAQRRLDHPTLPPGSRVRTAVSSMAAQFEQPPSDPTAEGFGGIAIIRSFKACLELVSLLSPPIQLFKFPRTAHLVDLGAATEDDLHYNSVDVSQKPPPIALDKGSRVIICEKIDGANLGISLDVDSRIVVQNRSHWVNSKTHFQFKRLDLWTEENREGLYHILARDETFPQRYVLFGEWMVCVHSIHYSRLPNQFLAFDLYDRSTETFASRDVMEGILKGTGIHMVPVLETRESSFGQSLTMPTEEELRAMVQGPSQFYDGRVEGVYVKVEKDGKVTGRGKVVRGDFIAGNEHWTRGDLTLNGIVR